MKSNYSQVNFFKNKKNTHVNIFEEASLRVCINKLINYKRNRYYKVFTRD